jgi:hypothetical protein
MPDVVELRHPRKVLGQHGPAERLDLAERDRPHPRPVKAERDPANAGE